MIPAEQRAACAEKVSSHDSALRDRSSSLMENTHRDVSDHSRTYAYFEVSPVMLRA